MSQATSLRVDKFDIYGEFCRQRYFCWLRSQLRAIAQERIPLSDLERFGLESGIMNPIRAHKLLPTRAHFMLFLAGLEAVFLVLLCYRAKVSVIWFYRYVSNGLTCRPGFLLQVCGLDENLRLIGEMPRKPAALYSVDELLYDFSRGSDTVIQANSGVAVACYF